MIRSFTFALVVAAALPAVALAQRPAPTVILPGFRSPVRMDSVGTPMKVSAPSAAVFHALRGAFDSIGVKPTVADSSGGILGNGELRLTRRFAGDQMSKWLDCGIGVNGPTANSYRIHMAIVAMLRPDGDATSVRIAVAAGAQAFSGPLGDPIACESRGTLEERVVSIVREATKAH